MFFFTCISVVCLLLIKDTFGSSSPITYDVIMIAEVFRHGARSTTSDPIMTGYEYDYENGLGQLTPNGMRQHYMLGS